MKRIRNIILLVASTFFVGMAGWIAYKSFFGTKSASKTVATVAPVVKKSVGMVLRGCGAHDPWLTNTNECSVLVRYVSLVSNFGERTNWMREVKMGETIKIENKIENRSDGMSPYYGFYIYNTAGGLVGYFSGDCPQPPSKK